MNKDSTIIRSLPPKQLILEDGTLGYRPDIDSLRAVAILLVLIFHAFPERLPGGFIGVDVFFVISGFLISSIIFKNLEKNQFNYLHFYARRIKRIFPALIVTLIGCYTIGWCLLFANEYKQLGKHIASGAFFISNFTLWNEAGYFDQSALTKPLLHLWSLAIEEQFYIFWPLLISFLWKRKYNLFILTVFIVLSFITNIIYIKTNSVAGFYSPLSRFWELLIGGFLAYFKLYQPNYFARQANFQSILGVTFIAISALLLNQEKTFPGFWALLPTMGTFLIISGGPKAWINHTILKNKILVWIGLISFPIYLIHWPLLSFARIMTGNSLKWEIRLFICLISVLGAWSIYCFIEKPVRYNLHKKPITISLALLLILSGTLGFITYRYNGFHFRFPPLMNEINNYADYDYRTVYREGSCFLKPNQSYDAFKTKSCTIGNPKYKSIFLWGDSHAAHLYPGLKEQLKMTKSITQLTASACPPILGLNKSDRPHCKKINDFVFQRIKEEKPNEVILAARWNAYDWQKVAITIKQLQLLGITNITLIGPVPSWIDNLPSLLLNNIRKNRLKTLPERLVLEVDLHAQELDKKLFLFAKEQEINYISPIKILCNQKGCLTTARAGKKKELMTWDEAHLTSTGSRMLVAHFPDSLRY
ncbi:acyltransferase [Legionella longbeachae]|uniref:acyltransferase family protein n=1 Tax=Legionella longbeachae TaxID=450 RepID=UPI000A1C065C|nr:acyltransferase family protein [Legionella longbeachae]ARM34285.1 acyltransferase [Legionella longbeachae]